MSADFHGTRAVVTGAAGGIGSAICERLAEAGAGIVAVDRDRDGLDRLARTVSVEPVTVDLTNREAVESAAAAVSPVDILVNNAGVTALGSFTDLPPESLEKVMAVNLLGSAWITRALLPSLVERQGRIAVLSSVAGFAPVVHRTGYAASKHALHGLFESLRAELAGTGVSVTMVCPAFADTGIDRRAVARAPGPDGSWTTTGRHLTADEVAAAVLRGLERRSRLVLPGTTAKASYLVSRLAPALYEWMMRRRIG